MDRQGDEGKPATQPANMLAKARPPSAGHSRGCQEAEEGALPLPQSVPAQLLLRGGEAPKATLAVRL